MIDSTIKNSNGYKHRPSYGALKTRIAGKVVGLLEKWQYDIPWGSSIQKKLGIGITIQAKIWLRGILKSMGISPQHFSRLQLQYTGIAESGKKYKSLKIHIYPLFPLSQDYKEIAQEYITSDLMWNIQSIFVYLNFCYGLQKKGIPISSIKKIFIDFNYLLSPVKNKTLQIEKIFEAFRLNPNFQSFIDKCEYLPQGFLEATHDEIEKIISQKVFYFGGGKDTYKYDIADILQNLDAGCKYFNIHYPDTTHTFHSYKNWCKISHLHPEVQKLYAKSYDDPQYFSQPHNALEGINQDNIDAFRSFCDAGLLQISDIRDDEMRIFTRFKDTKIIERMQTVFGAQKLRIRDIRVHFIENMMSISDDEFQKFNLLISVYTNDRDKVDPFDTGKYLDTFLFIRDFEDFELCCDILSHINEHIFDAPGKSFFDDTYKLIRSDKKSYDYYMVLMGTERTRLFALRIHLYDIRNGEFFQPSLNCLEENFLHFEDVKTYLASHGVTEKNLCESAIRNNNPRLLFDPQYFDIVRVGCTEDMRKQLFGTIISGNLCTNDIEIIIRNFEYSKKVVPELETQFDTFFKTMASRYTNVLYEFQENLPLSNAQKAYLELMSPIQSSTSDELKNIAPELMGQLYERFQDDIDKSDFSGLSAAIDQIVDVFENNSLPFVWKQFKVFSILFGDDVIMRGKINKSSVESFKRNTSNHSVRMSILQDLIKIHLESGDSNLMKYLQELKTARTLYISFIDGNQLSLADQNILKKGLIKLYSLIQNIGEGDIKQIPLSTSIEEICNRLQNISPLKTDIIALFNKLENQLGMSIDNALLILQESIRTAHERNKELSQKQLKFDTGFIKTISDIYLEKYLSQGVCAPEFIGSESENATKTSKEGDATPFDTDFCTLEGQEITILSDYGNIILYIGNTDIELQNQGIEITHPHVIGGDHRGFRTGIGSTYIHAIVIRENNIHFINKIRYTIAKNGFYIPICDLQGNILFSYDEYESLLQEKNICLPGHDGFNATLSAETTDIETLLNFLDTEYPDISQELVGVDEGYTLRVHVKMVLENFENYFASKLPKIGISMSVFRLLLLLHDIGKPDAVKSGDKNLQHKETLNYIAEFAKKYTLDQETVNLIKSIVDGDPIGDYIKGGINADECSKRITEMSHKTHLPTTIFFEILLVYYMSDASAYTKYATNGKESLDHLFMKKDAGLVLATDVQQKIQYLKTKIQ